jgi:hypothetical protein
MVGFSQLIRSAPAQDIEFLEEKVTTKEDEWLGLESNELLRHRPTIIKDFYWMQPTVGHQALPHYLLPAGRRVSLLG